MTSEACESQTTPSKKETNVPAKTLTDIRDGNVYDIAKLRDGKCWMTQDLNIIGPKTLTSKYSDLINDFPIPESNSSGFTSSTQYQSVANRYQFAANTYYNWFTITAGTGNGNSEIAGENAPNSICPKGWRLPTNDEFEQLFSGFTKSSEIIVAPYNFRYGGRTSSNSYSSTPSNYGTYGDYWSSTASDSTKTYILAFNENYLSASSSDNRYLGRLARCVAR